MTKRKYVLKNKRRFLSLIFIVLLITFISVYTVTASGHQEPVYKTVVVHTGDTLWSIAQNNLGGYEGDIRAYIYEIKRINNLDSSLLVENSSLIVPVKE